MTLIFIVGNSRSGTTMMGRILGKHPQVFSFHELHFLGELWTPEEQKVMTTKESQLLMAKLLCVQRDGYLTQGDPQVFLSEAKAILQNTSPENITPAAIFELFLMYESQKNNKLIPCEHTPGHVFYINEILELYPEAKIINMIRDPRDVLLSQKRKWKRHFLGGAKKIPLKEAVRAKVNYHPVTISKLWNSAVTAGEKFAQHERVYCLNFEELLQNPKAKVQEICAFLGISFEESLLDVPQIGSSSVLDQPKAIGIDSSKAGNWRKGGLSKTEVFLCQQITQEHRDKYEYSSMAIKPNYLAVIYSLASLPIQLTLALFFNLKRMRRIVDTIKRRLTSH